VTQAVERYQRCRCEVGCSWCPSAVVPSTQPANNRPLPNYSGRAVYCWPSVSDTCYGSLTTKQAPYHSALVMHYSVGFIHTESVDPGTVTANCVKLTRQTCNLHPSLWCCSSPSSSTIR